MNDKLLRNNKFYLISVMLIAVLWTVVIAFFHNKDNEASVITASIVFFAVAVVAQGITLFTEKNRHIPVEVMAPYYLIASGYALVAAVMNAVYIVVPKIELSVVVISNLIVIILFIMGIILSMKYMEHIADSSKAVADAVRQKKTIPNMIQSIIAVTEDEEIKNALKDLKKKVSYSADIVKGGDAGYEQAVLDALDNVYMLVSQKADKESVLGEIRAAEKKYMLLCNSR